MRTSTLLSSLLALLLFTSACQSESGGDVDPNAVLKQVESTYSSLDHYRFSAKIITKMKMGERTQNNEIPLTYAADGPGRIYLSVDQSNQAMKVISDGSQTWTYLPSIDQYTVEQAAQLNPVEESEGQAKSQTQGLIELSQQLIAQYAAITERMTKASYVKDSVLTLAQGKRPVHVIDATYEAKVESTNFEMSPQRFFIDTETNLVLRQENHASMDSPNGQGRVTMTQIIDISSAELSPEFAANRFTFDPPQGAEKVDQFTSPGMQNSGSREAPLVGKQAYDFSLSNLNGNNVALSDYRGKVVLIDFWATWCAPCRKAHPHIQALYDQYKDEGLVVLGINNESKQKAAQYMEENGYTFPTLLDLDRSVQAQYQVSAIPNVFVIDRNGNVAANLIGYRTKEQVEAAIKEVL
jgi:peroxiredoxin/outer membrane lipoprotein-sorting protein